MSDCSSNAFRKFKNPEINEQPRTCGNCCHSQPYKDRFVMCPGTQEYMEPECTDVCEEWEKRATVKPKLNAEGEAELGKLLAHYNGDSVGLLVTNMLMAMDESVCRSVPIDASIVQGFYNRARVLEILDD